MRRLAVLLLAVLMIGGCGGSDVAYTEVTSPPEGLPIPDDAAAAAANVTPTATPENGNVKTSDSADEDAVDPATGAVPAPVTEVPTTAPVTPVDPIVPEDTTDDDSGAAAPPPAEVPETPADTGGGAVAPENDQFCADNPGACNN